LGTLLEDEGGVRRTTHEEEGPTSGDTYVTQTVSNKGAPDECISSSGPITRTQVFHLPEWEASKSYAEESHTVTPDTGF
jgi:hypothetical protein